MIHRASSVGIAGSPQATTTVVLVEDHPLYADSLRLALERTGTFTVVGVAATETDAIDLIAEKQPDLAVIDVRLPRNEEGLLVLARAKPLSPGTRFVVLTGVETPSHVRKALQSHAAAFLSKDITLNDLLAAATCVLSGMSVLSGFAFSVIRGHERVTECPLSHLDLQVLKLLSEGIPVDEVAAQLLSSRSSVSRRIIQIERVLGVSNKTQAIVHAVRNGWI